MVAYGTMAATAAGPVPIVLRNPTPQANSVAMTTAEAQSHQQAALAGLDMAICGSNLGLGSPRLGMPNGLKMAQSAQLNGMNAGINPFNGKLECNGYIA